MLSTRSITLVTPARDEIENLPRLFAALDAQSVPIERWIICQNGSVDGTIQYLAQTPKPANVRAMSVLNIDVGTQAYALGFTYSRIVNQGFEHDRESHPHRTDFIGIIDADCFPVPDYYERLLAEFDRRPKLGILSGKLRNDDGTFLPRGRGFPRGNCRLWRSSCFDEAGYVIGMSADALSAIKAEIHGWDTDNLEDAFVYTREVGAKNGQSYYGRAAHYRGETALFAALKSAAIARKSPIKAWQFASGYAAAVLSRAPKVDDADIIKYSRNKLRMKVKGL